MGKNWRPEACKKAVLSIKMAGFEARMDFMVKIRTKCHNYGTWETMA
jgi:hypothetical protein